MCTCGIRNFQDGASSKRGPVPRANLSAVVALSSMYLYCYNVNALSHSIDANPTILLDPEPSLGHGWRPLIL